MSSRVPALDGLRGLAITLVLAMHFVHAPESVWWGVALDRVAHMGWIGVDLFFVLSGFLITGILLDTKARPGYYRSFYARRVLRIFPLYFTYLAVILLLPRTGGLARWLGAPYLAEHQTWFWTHTVNWLIAFEGVTDYAVQSGFGALWSLSIEEQFYVLWPFIVAVLSRRSLGRLAIGVVIAGLVFRIGLAWLGAPMAVLYNATLTRLDPLAIGALLAVLAREGGLARYWERLALAVCGVAVLALIIVAMAQFSRHPAELVFAATVPAVAVAWGMVLLHSLVRRGRWQQAMVSQPLRTLGKYSYAIYLLQAKVIHVLTHNGLTPERLGGVVYAALGVGVTFTLAWTSWHLLESRFLALKLRFPRSDDGSVVESGAVAQPGAETRPVQVLP